MSGLRSFRASVRRRIAWPLVVALFSTACVPAGPALVSRSASLQAGSPAFAVRSSAASAAPISNVQIADRLLAAHNRYRIQLGLPPMQWAPALAAGAALYAPRLGTAGALVHSPRTERPGIGENLWSGTAGAYTPEAMVGNWAEERAQFRPGIFPAVSTSGNWLDVSHYTQMIWPTTTHVGCAVHRAGRWDYLVCRYSPKGNIDGRRVP